MKESKLTDNQVKFKLYLLRCMDKEHCSIQEVLNCELYRNVGQVTFGLSEVEMDEVVE